MGICTPTHTHTSSDRSNHQPFTQDNIANRALMLNMLRKEDELYFSSIGQEHLSAHGGASSIEGGKVLQRAILSDFGFDTSDSSLANYRTVIHHYYRSPTDYDKEIMASVVYLRENKLLYYTTPKPVTGQPYIDVPIYHSNGTKTRLKNIIASAKLQQKQYLICAAFSLS